jgi:ATP-dependent helicase/nuclease subunit A
VPVVAPVGDRLIEGYVDLLYEDPDGRLVVVDWKTDRARTEAEIDASLARYRDQGAAYAVALAQATGRPVEKVVFVFCRRDEPAVERAITDADLAAAITRVRDKLAG